MLYAAQPCCLRRMPVPSNAEHAPECAFRTSRAENYILPGRKREGELAVHGPFRDPQTDKSVRPNESSRSGRTISGLSKVLFTILEECGLNSIRSCDESTRASYLEEIWRNSPSIVLCQGGGIQITLDGLVATAPNSKLGMKRIVELKKTIKSKVKWPPTSRPHGFLIGIVEGYKKTAESPAVLLKLQGWEREVAIETRPVIFAEKGTEIRSPYIAIISFAHPDRHATEPIAMRCYMQPCYKVDNCFPVDSGLERGTINLIKKCLKEHFSGCEYIITKPLFDMYEGITGEKCRPDFLLVVTLRSGRQVKLAVETMGNTDGEYLKSKKKTHPIMAKLCGLLVLHNAASPDPIRRQRDNTNFDKDLKETIINGRQIDYDTL
jgi:hypothetical protein